MKIVMMVKRIALILVIFLTAMAVTGESTRLVKNDVFNNLLENRLPRGPVPPSGPSFCHNKIDPSSYNGAKFQQDVICP